MSVVAAAAYAHAYAGLWADPGCLAQRLQRFTPQALQAWAAEPGVHLWIARVDAVPVGYLGLRLRSRDPIGGDPDAAELHRLYLLPNAAGQGLGRRLLHAAEACA
ncbi:MAG: GNAT family N-acetyltransferase, partial [Caulobacteraceae bacterium]|nr:GNAT family N-acetyltransferase [Caulobacter sp.]